MNESLYNNKISYLIEKENKISIFLVLSIILAIIITLSGFIKVRFSFKTTAFYEEENSLVLYWNYDEIDKLEQIEKIKIEDEINDFQIINMSEIKIDENKRFNYQLITISTSKKFHKNQIMTVELLDKKEKIIQKVKKIVLGG